MLRLGDKISNIILSSHVKSGVCEYGQYIITEDMFNFKMGLFESSSFFKHLIKLRPSLVFKKIGEILHFDIEISSCDHIFDFFDYILIIVPVYNSKISYIEYKNGFHINNRNVLGRPATEFYYYINHPNKKRIQTMFLNLGINIDNINIMN